MWRSISLSPAWFALAPALDITASTEVCIDVMRTTLTLDQDVARLVERLRRLRDTTFRSVVNDALRLGLRQLLEPPAAHAKAFRTREANLGPCRFAAVDDVQDVLAVADGERLP
jgi:hypothetical protein